MAEEWQFQEGGGESQEEAQKKARAAKEARQTEIGNVLPAEEEVEDFESEENGETEESEEEPAEEDSERGYADRSVALRQAKTASILAGTGARQEPKPDALERLDEREKAVAAARLVSRQKQEADAQAEEREKTTRSPADKLNDIIFAVIILLIAAFKDILDVVFEIKFLFQDLGFFATALTVAFLIPVITARIFQKPKKLAGKAIFYTGLGIATLLELIPLLNILPCFAIVMYYTMNAEMKANDMAGQLEGAPGNATASISK